MKRAGATALVFFCWLVAPGPGAFAATDFRPPTSPELAPAWDLMDAGQHDEAIALVERLAQAGDRAAVHLLGVFHKEGYVDSPSPRLAAKLLHQAASEGSGDAMYDLAGLLLSAEVQGWRRADPAFWKRMRSLGTREELRWKAFALGTPRLLRQECRVAGDEMARPGWRSSAMAWCRLAPHVAKLSKGERRELDGLRKKAERALEPELAAESGRKETRFRIRLIEEGVLTPGQLGHDQEKPKIPEFPADELVPLEVGNRWVYRVSDADQEDDFERVERIAERRASKGGELYRLVVDSPPDQPAMFRSTGTLGLYSAPGDPARWNGDEPTPFLWLAYPVPHALEYEAADASMKVTLAPDPVVVPAGRFRCLLYELFTDSTVVERTWVAPGVGIVRHEAWYVSDGKGGPGRVEELVTYQLGSLPASN